MGPRSTQGVWRSAGAFAAALLATVTTTGGLFFHAAPYQTGLVAGICAALVASSRRTAVATAAAAAGLGVLIGPSSVWVPSRTFPDALVSAGVTALAAAAAALAGRSLVMRAPRSARWLVWATVAVLIANVWVTTITLARTPGADPAKLTDLSLFQILSDPDVKTPVGDVSDQWPYVQVLNAVKRGEPYYTTWQAELGPKHLPGATAGNSVFNYNLPTRFWFWAALPGTSVSLVYAFLALASLCVAAVPLVMRGTVRLPLAVPGAAAVASYLFLYGGWTVVLAGEAWAGALALLALAAWARAAESERWRAWTVAAVALGVLAPLFREPAVLVPVAGLVAALAVRDGQRRFRAMAWASGLAVFAGLYLAHYLNARPLLSGPPVGATLRLAGIETIVSALTHGAPALGRSTTLPLLLALMGSVGILLVRDRRTRVFAGVAVFATLASFLVFGNAAWDAATRAPVNYWGTVIVPMLYACVPGVLAMIPAMAPAMPGGDEESAGGLADDGEPAESGSADGGGDEGSQKR